MVRTIRPLLLMFVLLLVHRPAWSQSSASLSGRAVAPQGGGAPNAELMVVSSALAPASAQSIPALSGVVVDRADAILPGARVTVTDMAGRVVHTSTTGGDGGFRVDYLSPGGYTVAVQLPLFVTATHYMTVPTTGTPPTLRIVLDAGGFSEEVVVTGRRVETRITDTPQKVEVVNAIDIERAVAADLTDVLKKSPERSTSFDVGAEWTSPVTRLDVTVFRTVVKDRFISNVVISNPPPPDPIVLSVANGLDAHISGVELEADHRLTSRIAVFANTTHYFNRKERLTSGLEQDILNVPTHTIRAGIDADVGPLGMRVAGRYVHGRKDSDPNQPGFPIVAYDDFTVVDANVTCRLARQHALVVAVNNLFDEFYHEKLGYPLQGTSFKAFYRVGF